MAGFGHWTLGEAGFFLFRGDHPVDPLRRVEPGLAQFVEAAGGGSDVPGGDFPGHARWRGVTRLRGSVARRQAGREGEGFEGGGRGVARIVADAEPSAEAQRPEFVEAGMQDAEGGVVGAGDDDNDVFRDHMPMLPNEKAMLGNETSCDIAGLVTKGCKHFGARTLEKPPLLVVFRGSTFLASWLDVSDSVFEGGFVKRRLTFAQLAEIDDPITRWALGEIGAVDGG